MLCENVYRLYYYIITIGKGVTRVVQSFSVPDGSEAHGTLKAWKSEGANISSKIQMLIEGVSEESEIENWPSDWKRPDSLTIEKIKQIKCILFDVDGVFTDGTILRDVNGSEQRRFSVIDGHGIQLLREAGIMIGIISRENSEITRSRMQKLRIPEVHVGILDKSSIVREIKMKHGFDVSEIAFMGDDLPDLLAFEEVGLRLSPKNAHPKIRLESDWVSKNNGGNGAVREAAEVILFFKCL
tara:strand:+ start:1301 stop:2023 length:723 start_codon:yes stop_codon:yes gene_type:complete